MSHDIPRGLHLSGQEALQVGLMGAKHLTFPFGSFGREPLHFFPLIWRKFDLEIEETRGGAAIC